jgi:very-short-patch-repair endonuclease
MKMSFIYNSPNLKTKRRKLRKNLTDAEKVLWKFLRNRQLDSFKFYRQFSVGSFILDFYCPDRKMAVELDGGHHAETRQEMHDGRRTNYLQSKNIHVLRFWNNEVLKNTEGVAEKIREELDNSS